MNEDLHSHISDVSVIVPTYNEAENLPHLVPRVFTALATAGIRGELIIVDDDSPDETGRRCRDLQEKHNLRLLVRKNQRGLATAVIQGIEAANARILVVMDADLSHPPELVPTFVRTLQQPHVSFVIGSRYVNGGATDECWGWFRWLNSKVATLMARPLVRCSDPMAGFFGIHRHVYEAAKPLSPVGYKIALELMVKSGVTDIREIPITFHNRRHGQSKLNLREQVNYLRHLYRLYKFKFASIPPAVDAAAS